MNGSNRILSVIGLLTVMVIVTAAVSFCSIWGYHALFASPPPEAATMHPTPAAPSPPERPIKPSGPPEPAVPSKDSPAEPVPVAKTEQRFCVWDPERLMSSSAAGKAIDAYARGYADVMDKNIAALNAALASKEPRLNAGEARKLIAQYRERKMSAPVDARKLLLSLTVETVKSLGGYENAFLVEKSAVTLAPESSDITPLLIAEFDRMKLNLPQLPKPIVLPEPTKTSAPKRGK